MIWAATEELRRRYDQTAMTCVLIAETNRDSKKQVKAFTVYDFHPLRHKPRRSAADWGAMRDLCIRTINNGSTTGN